MNLSLFFKLYPKPVASKGLKGLLPKETLLVKVKRKNLVSNKLI